MKMVRWSTNILIMFLTVGGSLAVLGQNAAKPPADFLAFLIRADAAQKELQNGNVGNYKKLWSHSDDVTISGGFGGTIERGWQAVGARLDWASTQFSNGTNTIERLSTAADKNLGYVVQLEHIKFKVPGTGADATRDFRVTMIFRREKDGWKIVHRHADGQMKKEPSSKSS